jgi:SAM-dependent methyltransferase
MSLADRLHEGVVFPRRLRVLRDRLLEVLPETGSVLDVGCGDGRLARMLEEARPGLGICGLDVLVRDKPEIPVERYDGLTLPRGADAVDVILFVDVLHHAEDPRRLLAEASRVARTVVLKDHLADRWLSVPRLRLMDYVGNARHGVALRNDYWPRREWDAAFAAAGLSARAWNERLGLYPFPASWVFERGLHFVARLERTAPRRS